MKYVLTLITLVLAQSVFAADLNVSSCEESGVTLNTVEAMRIYGNGGIKIFATDMIEPAAASVGVAVAIDRGSDLSNMESFCRYVSGLSGVDLKKMKSSYNSSTNTLTLTTSAAQTNENGISKSKTLVVQIKKGAANEADLVTAKVK